MLKTIAQAFGLIMTSGYEAYGLIQTAVGGIPVTSAIHRWDLAVVFVVFCVFVGWAIVDRESQLRRIRNAKPRLVIKNTRNVLGGFQTFEIDPITKKPKTVIATENTTFTYVYIANEPVKPEWGIKAEKVYGEVTMWDELGTRSLFTMRARWAETEQVAEGGKPIQIEQIDLEPNGRPFPIDIGMKTPQEDWFYGYNNDAARNAGFRDTENKVGVGVYCLQTRFRCTGVDTSFWFRLDNFGIGHDISLQRIQKPISRKEGSQP